jgi:hypothetical protein
MDSFILRLESAVRKDDSLYGLFGLHHLEGLVGFRRASSPSLIYTSDPQTPATSTLTSTSPGLSLGTVKVLIAKGALNLSRTIAFASMDLSYPFRLWPVT